MISKTKESVSKILFLIPITLFVGTALKVTLKVSHTSIIRNSY
jgi:hypothetical protein